MREHYDEIQGAGAQVVAIGTGSRGYAEAFVRDERVPFPVLVDDDAHAAAAAGVRSSGFFRMLFNRASRPGYKRAKAAGHKIHRAGKRVTQLGATLVVGPGDVVRYEHYDEHSADHAPLEDVISAVAS